MSFQRPAVFGATPMAGEIACLFANVGIQVFIYDRPANNILGRPNEHSINLINQLLNDNPSSAIAVEALHLLEARNYRDHWNLMAEHDLIIDCTADDLNAKQALWTRVLPALNKQTVLLSTTAGQTVSPILEALPSAFRSRFLGISHLHRLTEFIPTPETLPKLMQRIQQFWQNQLGQVVIQVPDIPNHLSRRLALFSWTSACYHGDKWQMTPAELEVLTGRFIERSEGSVGKMVKEWGGTLYEWIDLIEENEKKRFGDLWKIPDDFQLGVPNMTVSSGLKSAWQKSQWHKIKENEHHQAQFLRHYLEDFYQYCQYLREQYDLSETHLDLAMRYGLGWQESAIQQIQRFSPTVLNKYLSSRDYPILPLTAKRRNKSQATQSNNPVAREALLWESGVYSQTWLYDNRILIWQPRSSAIAFNTAVIKELLRATQTARNQQYALLIYHHGQHFDLPRNWEEEDESALNIELDAMVDLIVALRLLPRPFVVALTGSASDYGCAILMQADQIICEADLRFHFSTVEYGFPIVGGVVMEWLRRLPAIDEEHYLAQIHASFKRFLHDNQFSVHSAKNTGLLRMTDILFSHQDGLPPLMPQILNQCLFKTGTRLGRYGLPSLNDAQLERLFLLAEDSANPRLYRQMLSLLRQKESKTLALSVFLRQELALVKDYFQLRKGQSE